MSSLQKRPAGRSMRRRHARGQDPGPARCLPPKHQRRRVPAAGRGRLLPTASQPPCLPSQPTSPYRPQQHRRRSRPPGHATCRALQAQGRRTTGSPVGRPAPRAPHSAPVQRSGPAPFSNKRWPVGQPGMPAAGSAPRQTSHAATSRHPPASQRLQPETQEKQTKRHAWGTLLRRGLNWATGRGLHH